VLLFPVVELVTAGDHTNVYGLVPPLAVVVMLPLFPPKQLTFVWVVLATAIAPPLLVIVTVCVVVMHGVWVIVTVYVPGHNPVAVAAFPPDGAQLYV
jgi:hypothetical protein